MLDVHPPHHAVRGWREFLVHLATITVGLLIALGLEAAVEALHHRHLAERARERIHAEIERNRTLADRNLQALQQQAETMRANAAVARALRDHAAVPASGLQFSADWRSFDDSAWHTARDTGALAYMPAEEVQRYTDAYGQQDIANQQAIELYAMQTTVAAPLLAEGSPEALRPDELQALMLQVAAIHLRLRALANTVGELHRNYEEASRASPAAAAGG
jgi:hypothetical protein